jgi:hypothetical protein
MGADRRESCPTATAAPSTKLPNAQAKSTISSGVSVSPTTPLTQEIPILSGFMQTRIREIRGY